MANKSATSGQMISLPKGGGALQGMGEKFSPDLFTGTGNFTVPIALPPGRNGLQPQLNLVYSTGNGNGPFGLGWSLSIPGASLTVLVLVMFRRLFFGSRSTLAMLLMILDCLRWINLGLLTVTAFLPYHRADDTLTGIFAVIGLIFPTAYSVVALMTIRATDDDRTAAWLAISFGTCSRAVRSIANTLQNRLLPS